jgi:hypothetical protein
VADQLRQDKDFLVELLLVLKQAQVAAVRVL